MLNDPSCTRERICSFLSFLFRAFKFDASDVPDDLMSRVLTAVCFHFLFPACSRHEGETCFSRGDRLCVHRGLHMPEDTNRIEALNFYVRGARKSKETLEATAIEL